MKLKDCKSAKDFRAAFAAHPVVLFLTLKAAPASVVDLYEKEGKPGEGITLRKFTACAAGLKAWRDSLPHGSALREAAAAVEAHLRHGSGMMSHKAALSYAGTARASGSWQLSGNATKKFEPGSAQPRPKEEKTIGFSEIPEALAALARAEDEAEAAREAETKAAAAAALASAGRVEAAAARAISWGREARDHSDKAKNAASFSDATEAEAAAAAAAEAAAEAAAAAAAAAEAAPYATGLDSARANRDKAAAAAAAAAEAAEEAAAAAAAAAAEAAPAAPAAPVKRKRK